MHSVSNFSTQALDGENNLGVTDFTPAQASEWQGENHPTTIVLQPNQELNRENLPSFQQALEEALELATESVIVDLLWVEMIDAGGVAVLVAAAERAVHLGKILSFQSMNHPTRLAVETEWEQQRQIRFGSWRDRFAANLEPFLDKGRKG